MGTRLRARKWRGCRSGLVYYISLYPLWYDVTQMDGEVVDENPVASITEVDGTVLTITSASATAMIETTTAATTGYDTGSTIAGPHRCSTDYIGSPYEMILLQ